MRRSKARHSHRSVLTVEIPFLSPGIPAKRSAVIAFGRFLELLCVPFRVFLPSRVNAKVCVVCFPYDPFHLVFLLFVKSFYFLMFLEGFVLLPY